jgi:hypothetical protein
MGISSGLLDGRRWKTAERKGVRGSNCRMNTWICKPLSGQWLVNQIVHRESILIDVGWQVEYHWVPGRADIEGNKQADKATKEAAPFPVDRGIGRMTRNEQFTSLSHLHRRTKELKWKETKEWIKATIGNRPGYIIPPTRTRSPRTSLLQKDSDEILPIKNGPRCDWLSPDAHQIT